MSSTSFDRDYLYRLAMSAIARIAAGQKNPKTVVAIKGDYGRDDSIEKLLRNGSALRDVNFRDEHARDVELAFAQFGVSAPSRKVGEC